MENYSKKIVWTVFILLFFLKEGKAQYNLVPNPSFEILSDCPTQPNLIQNAIGWINPNSCSPDLFNSCNSSNSSMNVPNYAQTGYLEAHTGGGYLGIYTYGGSEEFINVPREYGEIKLLNKLSEGKKYLAGFHACLRSDLYAGGYSINIATNNIGMLLTDTLWQTTNQCYYFNAKAQVENDSTNPLTNRTFWRLVSDTIVAKGGEEFITVGNFNPDSTTDTVILGINTFSDLASYYLIDDVFVIPLDSLTGIKEQRLLEGKAFISNNQLNLELEESYKPISIMLSTATGQTVWQHNEFYSQGQQTFILPPLSSGLHFLDVKSGSGVFRAKVLFPDF